MKILIVEDDQLNQKVVQHFFEGRGIDCDIAGTGARALSLVHSETYDLIFMDLRIPNLDGFAAARAIRQTGCIVPIIALTASSQPDDEKNCLEAGMDAFMTKPFSSADFEHVLKRWIYKED